MSDNEQRCSIKFCFRLGYNATKIFAKLQQAYGDSVCQRSRAFRCFKAFSEGRESIEDESRSGRPSVSKTAENIVRVRDLVRSDRHLTLIMANSSDQSFSPTNLGRVEEEMVPPGWGVSHIDATYTGE
ncbi:UNVERIFIED_CONTAM: hypothetical protein NCL1_09330 [Trichonephila clavipes]